MPRNKKTEKKVLLLGYGSIGRRNARNLRELGITPYIITNHPDGEGAFFVRDINSLKERGIDYCIIASATARHLADLRRCLAVFPRMKYILIEKPLECSYMRGRLINGIAKKYRLKISVAYNLRFLPAFRKVAEFVQKNKKSIRIIEAVAGQDLKEWRPGRGIKSSYSAFRKQGGGVDLDLSHEIDYILWLFTDKIRNKVAWRAKISRLPINSPDIFKLILGYKGFIADITLDYIRSPKERYLRIICENAENLHYDFISGTLRIGKRVLSRHNDMNDSYKEMLKAFLGINKNQRQLCTLKEGLNTLRVLEV